MKSPIALYTGHYIIGFWKNRRVFWCQKEFAEQTFSLAVKILASHTGSCGFNSEFWLSIPALCSYRTLGCCADDSRHWVLRLPGDLDYAPHCQTRPSHSLCRHLGSESACSLLLILQQIFNKAKLHCLFPATHWPWTVEDLLVWINCWFFTIREKWMLINRGS